MNNENENNVVETKVVISDRSVEKLIAKEVARIVLENEDMASEFISKILHTPIGKKEYPRDPEPLTFFEKCVVDAMAPVIKDEIASQCEKYKKKIQAMIRRAYGETMVEDGQLEKAFREAFSEAMSKITFYFRN